MDLHDTLQPIPLQYARRLAGPRAERLSDWLLRTVDRHRRWMLLGVLVIYAVGFNAQWRIDRDSALYLTIGRNLAGGKGYTFRDEPHHLAYPGLPMVFSTLFHVFPEGSLWPALVMMLLMGAATVALTYRLFYLFAGRPTAVVMTVGLGCTRLFYRYCFELLSDLPFLLGAMALLAGYEAIFCSRDPRFRDRSDVAPPKTSPWIDWTLLLGGISLAMAMRPTVWALLAALGFALFWRIIRGQANRNDLILIGLMIGSIVLYRNIRPGADRSGLDEYEGDLFRQINQWEFLRHQINLRLQILFEAALIKALWGCSLLRGLNTFVGIVIVIMGIWLFRVRVLWGLFVAITLGMLLMFKPVDRYLLPIIPLLMFGWWRMLVWLNHKLPYRIADLAFVGLFVFGFGTNIARIGEMAVEQRHVPFLKHYHDGRYVSAHDVARLLTEQTPQDAVILAEPKVGRIMTFLAHRDVYDSDDAHANPLTPRIYALLGPSWEEGKFNGKAVDPVRAWIANHGMQLGEEIGSPIKGKHERLPWTLYKVEPASAPHAPLR